MHDKLKREVSQVKLSHWAPNCSTFSRARERPIKGVKFPPAPLRSPSHPTGIPEVLGKLPPAKRRKVMDDARMAIMSAENCEEAHLRGDWFSLEHPRNSLARHLPSWERLESLPGVFVTEYNTCRFAPSTRRKNQCLIHNIPSLVEEIGLKCSGKHCLRTGLEHDDWNPVVKDGRVVSFATGEEREYILRDSARPMQEESAI